ncbi:MAG TPA: ABC transporter permease, partial [Chitinophagaceae bacterium]|nr:ABC transporter permease [Chitinophagaceae bacterium]
PFAFPETWHSVAYFSSWFVMIPSILVIMVITNEYTYKTHRQNIIDGMSRQEFMLGKMIDVAIIAGVATIMCALVATGFG